MSEAQRLREMGFRESLRVRGIPLFAPDRRTVTGMVTPIGLQPDAERLEENLSGSVLITVPRDAFPGGAPSEGQFVDPESRVAYRITGRAPGTMTPGIEFTCEVVEEARPR